MHPLFQLIYYTAKYDVIFNAKKSLLIIYKCTWRKPPDPNVYINNVKVACVNGVIRLGHILNEDIFKFNASKCVANFNIRNVLFNKYCTTFYSSQVLPMFNTYMEEVYIAWRVAIHRVWRVPWTTHCKLLPHLANLWTQNYDFQEVV